MAEELSQTTESTPSGAEGPDSAVTGGEPESTPSVSQKDIDALKSSYDKKLALAHRGVIEARAEAQKLQAQIQDLQNQQNQKDESLMTAEELAEARVKRLEAENTALKTNFARVQEELTYGPLYHQLAQKYGIDWDNPPEGLDLAPDARDHGTRLARIALSAAALKEKELEARLSGTKDEIKKQLKDAENVKPNTPKVETGGPSGATDIQARIRTMTDAQKKDILKRARSGEKILPSQVL